MTEGRVDDLLDKLTPNYEDRVGDWDRVVADARRDRHRRFRVSLGVRLSALVAAVAVGAVLVLAWPFGEQHGTVLERALAEVGDGSVLHVILRGEWGGTEVDLLSGARTPVYGDNEVWFDTESGLTHSIERLGGVVQGEELSKPYKPAAELAALGREYKQALEAGSARIRGQGTISGEPVVWVVIHSELVPDVSDGKDHEWAQQVAVSMRTFKAVALRETRDGQPGPGTLRRVLELELLSRSDADFTTLRPSRNGTAVREGRDPIELDHAQALLGHPPLWLGHDYHGLPLAQVYRERTSIGHQKRVRVTGAKAAAALKCQSLSANAGDCFRALGLGSVEITPEGVFSLRGPVQWGPEQSAVVFFYGTLGDDRSTYPADTIPQFDNPYVTVTESTHLSPIRRGAGSYVPPAGSVFLAASGMGFMQRDGLQISIGALNESTVIAIARALRPMRQESP